MARCSFSRFQSPVAQDPVFSNDRDDVGGGADGNEIEVAFQLFERNLVALGIAAHQLETDPATRQFVEGTGYRLSVWGRAPRPQRSCSPDGGDRR